MMVDCYWLERLTGGKGLAKGSLDIHLRLAYCRL